MDPAAFSMEWETGRAMTLEQAVACALEVSRDAELAEATQSQ
jgi:hypothetical protein